MNLKQQVCSLDLAKRLKELGVKQESYFGWYEHGEPEWEGHTEIFVGEQSKFGTPIFAAFTVAELGEMLPKVENLVTMFFENGRYQICLQGNIENDDGIATRWGAAGQSIESDTEADARAKMLVSLIENKLLPTPTNNK